MTPFFDRIDLASDAVKRDANHAAIRTAAQEYGVWLLDTYQFAQFRGGFPDMLWLSPQTGETWYIEVKNGFDEPLTKKEHKFADMVRAKNGVYLVIHSLDEAIQWLKAMRGGRVKG